MTRIISIGEAMVEMAPLADNTTFQMGFAGDTMNTAWYLRRLLPDATIDFCSAVGTDEISNSMVDFLDDAGLGTAHVFRRTDRSCGLYMIQLTNAERSFSYWRSDSAARTLACDPGPLRDAVSGADFAYFSGITIAILPQSDRAVLLGVLNDFRADGGTVVFDPNLRPRLWQDTDEMRSAVMAAAGVSDVVLPSYEDEAAWFDDATPTDTARRYQAAGAYTVIVKNGADQITALENNQLSQHEITPVTGIIDTTAAGDSFNAGFMASVTAGNSLNMSIESGANLSAKVIQSRGALVI